MNFNFLLHNVTVASWQIYAPIAVVIFMGVWYACSKFARQHLLFIYSLFLTIFIPLYPKIPLQGIRNTFVYIRLDDIFVAIGVALWLFYLLRHKVTWKTPLTIPILTYWGIGLLSTVIAVLFIFPSLPNVFPHDAFLFYLRHIEYLIVFFLAAASMRDKQYLPWLVGTIIISLLLVVAYGFGQAKDPTDFVAFSTMNEEFAKGEPLILASGARIQSTFGGHYDLAAYLVMLVPLIGSLVFGVKKLYLKLLFIATSVLGLILLLMTASRTSYAVYLVAIVFMLILQRKKKWIIPVLVVSFLLLSSFHTLTQRFADTLTQQQVVINKNTGKAIGVAQNDHGKIKVVDKPLVGQNLAPGSGYIISSDIGKMTTQVIYQKTTLRAGSESAQITDLQGDFVVKKALAYDNSFTTRFQGEWPRAMTAFLREPLLGSGYSSISLASDNNYLRMLGETGALGLFSYLFIFLFASIYAYRILPDVTSQLHRSFVIGTFAAIVGLGLNAVLIDVFEASKDAYMLWLLLGFSMGILTLYHKGNITINRDVLNIFTRTRALYTYLLLTTVTFFWMMLSDFFVSDDFFWLKKVADCKKIVSDSGSMMCQPVAKTFLSYFTQSQDFFYRPAEKLYFYFVYIFSGFNAVPFHVASLLIHWLCGLLIFMLSQRILKSKLSAFVVAVLFLMLSIHEETVFWISASGHLLVGLFILLGVWCADLYMRKRNKVFLVASIVFCIIAPWFHESGIVASLLVFVYLCIFATREHKQHVSNLLKAVVLLLPLPIYFFLRINAGSMWATKDYSYDVQKLPFNFFGNLIGYFFDTLFGITSSGLYDQVRTFGKQNEMLTGLIILVVLAGIVGSILSIRKKMQLHDWRVLSASIAFFVIPLLPFLGLGNTTTRYDYLASFGELLFIVYLGQKIVAIKTLNRKVSAAVCIVAIIFFGWYQFHQLQVVNKDWLHAGNTTYNSLQNLSSEYSLPGTLPVNPVFYFSHVPAKYGYAWVYNTGLPEAVWMVFREKNVTVQQTPDIAISLQEGVASSSARFYDFDTNGAISETKLTTITVPVKK